MFIIIIILYFVCHIIATEKVILHQTAQSCTYTFFVVQRYCCPLHRSCQSCFITVVKSRIIELVRKFRYLGAVSSCNLTHNLPMKVGLAIAGQNLLNANNPIYGTVLYHGTFR